MSLHQGIQKNISTNITIVDYRYIYGNIRTSIVTRSTRFTRLTAIKACNDILTKCHLH